MTPLYGTMRWMRHIPPPNMHRLVVCPHPTPLKPRCCQRIFDPLSFFYGLFVHLPFIFKLCCFHGFWRGTMSLTFPRVLIPCMLHYLPSSWCTLTSFYCLPTRVISSLYIVPLPSSPIASQRNIGGSLFW